MTLIAAGTLLLSACASKRNLVKEPGRRPTIPQAETRKEVLNAEQQQLRRLQFMQRVVDNSVYVKNIVGDMKFNLKAGSKDITVSGSLHMRKDEVIRLQLFMPLLGTEIGRLEFTPAYVLVIDRLHREYVKADYTQLDFLKSNGLTFYSLQALFWNQLFMPGRQSVAEQDLATYDVDTSASDVVGVKLRKGNLSVDWQTEPMSAQILGAKVNYASQSHGASTLAWAYSDFRAVGVKQFPATQKFTFTTSATKKTQTATVTIRMDEVTTKDKWDAETKVSDRYKQIPAQDILKKIMSL